jgi:hypothetical protein
MCGPYEHSHFRETYPYYYEVAIDRAHNSHGIQRQKDELLRREERFPIFPPVEYGHMVGDTPRRRWYRSGVSLERGFAQTNDDVTMPGAVKDALEQNFQKAFPTRKAIMQFIYQHAATLNDGAEWYDALAYMIDDRDRWRQTPGYLNGESADMLSFAIRTSIPSEQLIAMRHIPGLRRMRTEIEYPDDMLERRRKQFLDSFWQVFRDKPNAYWSAREGDQVDYPERAFLKVPVE